MLKEGVVVCKSESDLEYSASSGSNSCPSLIELPIPNTQIANRLSASHVSLVDIRMPNTLHTLPMVVRGICVQKNLDSSLGTCSSPPEGATLASKEHDEAIATFAREDRTLAENIHLVNSPLQVGTYLLEYNNSNAKSSARSSNGFDLDTHQSWLHEAFLITLDPLAVMTFLSLVPSLDHNFNLGFLCLWRCLNDKVAGRFAVNNIEHSRDRGKETTFNCFVDAIASTCRVEWRQLILKDIR